MDQSLTLQNIKFGFRVTRIWPFNPRAIDNRTTPWTIYTTTWVATFGNEEGESEEDYISGHWVGQNEQEQIVATELFHITNLSSTIEASNDP